MPYSTPPTKNPADPILSGDWNTYVKGNLDWLDGRAMQLIAETILGASAAVISFTGIPATYEHLVLVLQGGLTGVADTRVFIEFNADAAGGRQFQSIEYVNNALTTVTAGNMMPIGRMTGNAAGLGGSMRATVYNYARGTFHKHYTSHAASHAGTGAGTTLLYLVSGVWHNVAAINRLDVKLESIDSFAAASVFQLYGLR